MRAFKFLRPGAVGPLTGVEWPLDGDWIDSPDPPSLCRSGIHAMRVAVLPMWIAEELWEVEVDGVEEFEGILVGRRGRLLERVTAWNDHAAREYAEACADNLPAGGPPLAQARADDVRAAVAGTTAGPAATAMGYMAAQAAETATPGGYAAERRRQAAWLAGRLGLLDQPHP